MTAMLPVAALTRSVSGVPTSWDPETRTFEAVIATTNPVARRDARGAFAEVLTPSTLTHRDRIPLLDSHRTASVRDLVGVAESIRVEGDRIVATLRVSNADDVAPIAQRIADGSLSGMSIGYRVAGWIETTGPGGGRIKSPAAWEITEVTLTTNPADPDARVRSEQPSRAEGDPVTHTSPQTAPVEDGERSRRADIRQFVRSAGLPAETADDLIDTGATVADAKAAAFDAMQSRARTAPLIRTHAPQNDDPAVILRRQSAALAARMAGGECPEEARQHLGDSCLDLARGSLARAGVSTRGMSADEVFARAAAHGTSDFPLVISNAMGKVALDTYRAAETPLKQLCRQRTLPNFKPSASIRLGEMGRLEPLAESGEITHTSRAEHGETLSLGTYARGITVSRNLLIDDDLNLLGDMTRAFAEAAAQTEADILVDLLTGNPDLSDGAPVFDAGRGNLAGTGVTLGDTGDTAALAAARKSMRGVTGLDGKTLISVAPRFLLVGPESETAAETLLASIYAATVADVNIWPSKLTLLVEPRIADESWYLFADPARMPCLAYAYLSSAQGVQIQRAEAWNTLGLKFRAFLDFGAGWTDWRGVYLNQGGS